MARWLLRAVSLKAHWVACPESGPVLQEAKLAQGVTWPATKRLNPASSKGKPFTLLLHRQDSPSSWDRRVSSGKSTENELFRNLILLKNNFPGRLIPLLQAVVCAHSRRRDGSDSRPSPACAQLAWHSAWPTRTASCKLKQMVLIANTARAQN